MKCNDIKSLRDALDNQGWQSEEKPNGQIKHALNGCICNTYNTGSVVVQGKHEKYETDIKKIIDGINNIGKVA